MTDYMRVTPPVTITPALLTSTTVAEPATGEAVYNGATTYAQGARVISTTLHWEWESAAGGNVGNALPTEANTSNEHWLKVGPTNRYRMFDLNRDTASTGASPMTIVLTPGQRINTLGAVGLIADSITITVTSVAGGGTVYSYTQNLQTRQVFNWRDHLLEPFEQTPSIVRYDIPEFTDAVITVTLTRSSGDVSIGGLIIGRYVELGEVEVDAERDTLNFSTIAANTYGDTEVTPRRSVPKTSQVVWADKSRSKRLLRTKTELDAKVALWTGISDVDDGNFEPLLIVGLYTRWSMPLRGDQIAQQLEIRGF
jgi:hypothetical protein